MMKQLIPFNTGGGVKASPVPQATLNENGALTLNLAADELIGGDKWHVFYEDDSAKTPAFELKAASKNDASAYAVTRSGGSAAKITIRSLKNEIRHADKFVGKYSVSKVAGGLRLTRIGAK